MTEKRAIAVGDLVQIVRWPSCGCLLGTPGKVVGFTTAPSGHCMDCSSGAALDHNGQCARVQDSQGVAVVPLEWLKRFPPLDEPAETYTTEQHKEKV